MSIWQFGAAVEGYNAAHSTEDEKPEPPSDEEFEDMKARLLN